MSLPKFSFYFHHSTSRTAHAEAATTASSPVESVSILSPHAISLEGFRLQQVCCPSSRERNQWLPAPMITLSTMRGWQFLFLPLDVCQQQLQLILRILVLLFLSFSQASSYGISSSSSAASENSDFSATCAAEAAHPTSILADRCPSFTIWKRGNERCNLKSTKWWCGTILPVFVVRRTRCRWFN